MLGQDQRTDTGHEGGGERVASGDDPATVEPCDLDVDATREKFDRRTRVVQELKRVLTVVAGDRDHRGEAPRITAHVEVMCRCDENRAGEVRVIGDLVQQRSGLAPGRGKAEVDDLATLLDSPAEPGEQGRRATL